MPSDTPPDKHESETMTTSSDRTERDRSRHDETTTADYTESSQTARPAVGATISDGGTAAGADDVVLDPWGSASVGDYNNLFEQFGIEEFDDILADVPDPHYLMRRSIIFGHRDYDRVLEAMAAGEPFAALSGLMPSGEPHIGHKLVFDELIWHQQVGGESYGVIADLEAHAARGLSWAEIDQHTRDYLLSLLALGFDPEDGELYRQSTNRDVQDLAFELGAEANFSEFQAIYDFDGETHVSHMESVVTQSADILYPQLEEPKPTVIPVGPDQDPHMRLTRDLTARMRYFGVTEAYASFELTDDERALLGEVYDDLMASWDSEERIRCQTAAIHLGETDREGIEQTTIDSLVNKLMNASEEPLRPRVRVLDRRATDEAFEAMIEAIDGEKRVYDAHIDVFEMEPDVVEARTRSVEVAHGGYGFHVPSSIYHRFMTGLTGGKMSSSVPASHISLLDDPAEGYDKVKSATTGGRETAELQRELGGEADDCPVYELYAYLLAGDDDDLATTVYEECVGGERLCGDCKEQAAVLMSEFLEAHQEKREEMEPVLEALDVELDVAGMRRG